jgi:cytochrome c biogenesis protein ResB
VGGIPSLVLPNSVRTLHCAVMLAVNATACRQRRFPRLRQRRRKREQRQEKRAEHRHGNSAMPERVSHWKRRVQERERFRKPWMEGYDRGDRAHSQIAAKFEWVQRDLHHVPGEPGY